MWHSASKKCSIPAGVAFRWENVNPWGNPLPGGRRLKFGRRASTFLVLGFTAILGCMLAGMYIGIQHLELTREAWLRDAAFREKVRAAFLMREAIRERSFRLAFAAMLEDFFDRDAQQDEFRAAATIFVTARQELEKLSMTPEEMVEFEKLRETLNKARPVVDDAMAHVVQGDNRASILNSLQEGLKYQGLVIADLNRLVKAVEETSLREGIKASRAVEATQRKMMGLSVSAVALALFIGIMVVVRETRQTRELREHRDRLAKLSTTDALTGIANRRRFDEIFDLEWCRATRSHAPLSLIMIDVDHFKAYNDEYGHAGGDQCLAAVAGAISSVVTRTTDLASRYGGEEFACVLSNTDNKGAVLVAERVRQAVESLKMEHRKSSAGDHVTVSLGVATFLPDRADSHKELFARADQCLYRAKEKGRNQVVPESALVLAN